MCTTEEKIRDLEYKLSKLEKTKGNKEIFHYILQIIYSLLIMGMLYFSDTDHKNLVSMMQNNQQLMLTTNEN